MKKALTLKEFASLGGKARWSKLDKDQRTAVARNAVKARWLKREAKPLTSDQAAIDAIQWHVSDE